MTPEILRELVVEALDEVKGQDVLALDVSGVSTITDWMVIGSGTSSRHVKALVDSVVEQAKAAGQPPLGVEGLESLEWVLVDLGDVVVHVMQAATRSFYDLERLWKLPATPEASLSAPVS
ncbi:MAG: ribosome silencing factor [Pseudomonadales bacterium]|jgi:ribosome-associated protein|nr:ribosome silencing factor [Pseudomonadales bacterium]